MTEPQRKSSWLLILCYLPLFGLVPLLVESGSSSRAREIRWHARNGLLLFGGVVLVGIAATALSMLFQSLACLYSVAMFFVGVLYVILVVLAIVKALQGERLIFPVLSRYADRG